MTNPTFIIIFLIFLNSYTNKNHIKSIRETITKKQLDLKEVDTIPSTFDTTIMPFKDHSYKLILHVFNTNGEYLSPDSNNAVITYIHSIRNRKDLIFRDSIYCMYAAVEHKDFNNDKVKDLIFFHYSGARANPTYYLFLVDKIHHKLTKVKGFEELPNPELDGINNIITSAALYGGKVGWSFYRINSKGKLIDLGHSFEDDLGGDDDKYNKAIKAIIKESK